VKITPCIRNNVALNIAVEAIVFVLLLSIHAAVIKEKIARKA
jgi:hypothetical protein